MNIRKILLRFFIIIMSFIDIVRLILLVQGIYKLGRMPTFMDGLSHKGKLFAHQTDENILLFGHFLFPIFAFLMIAILIHFINYKKEISKWEIGLAISLILFEIGIRFIEGYEFIMFD